MPTFDPSDPFPLTHLDYAQAQEHSRAVDEWLDIRTEETEALVRKRLAAAADHGQQLWADLPVKAMLTPYTEIRTILAEIGMESGSQVVDLGAGYGRMGFVIAKHYPESSFTGYEYVTERVTEGSRCLKRFLSSLPKGSRGATDLLEADLSDPSFSPTAADVYFLYDYGTSQAIRKTLDDLREISTRQAVTVVGRGRASRDAIDRECPWLSGIVRPRHFDHFSIYRSAGAMPCSQTE